MDQNVEPPACKLGEFGLAHLPPARRVDGVPRILIKPEAKQLGRRTVDGLEMLIRQAGPSFEVFYGRAPPSDVDVRALCLAVLEAKSS